MDAGHGEPMVGWGRAGLLCPFCYVTHAVLPLPALTCLGYLPLATETSSGPGWSVQDNSLPPASPSPFDALLLGRCRLH